MLRAWRLLSAQPSLQRLPRRIGGGPSAVRFLTVSEPGAVGKPVDPSEDAPKSAEELGKQNTLMLGRLLKAGEAPQAWEMFEGLLKEGHAGEHHVTTMLKACASSNEQRALVSRAEEAGVTTAATTYNFLLDSVRVEGQTEEVEALQQVMERRGIDPNEQTAKVLAKSNEELSKQRTAKLGRMLKAGEAQQAWELFEGLLERGHVGEYQLTAMLKACPSSNEQRALVNRAEGAGVTTAVPTYTLLLGNLLFEGRSSEADALQLEMERRGIEPDAITNKVLAKTTEELGKQRTAVLNRLLRSGDTDQAWELFNGLLERGHADTYHLTSMLKACATSDEGDALTERAAGKGVSLPGRGSMNPPGRE